MKTQFEKAVIIRMRRLRKKKRLFEKMQKELENTNTKEEAANFISGAAIRLSMEENPKYEQALRERQEKGEQDC
jgi:mannose/fructose/N-acetylgalactosamine-specific phosphotransferase system component IID